jgi:hypothetical protein
MSGILSSLPHKPMLRVQGQILRNLLILFRICIL